MVKKLLLWIGVAIIGFAIGITFSHSFIESPFNTFFNSNFLLALITLFGATIAIYIYYRQKKDSKKDAANIIYLEIESAAEILKQSKEGIQKGNLPENVLIEPSMPTESWTRYKYLFVRDFEKKDWEEIEDFYRKCVLFDLALEHNNSMFQKNEEQIRVNLDRFLAYFVKESKINSTKIDSSKVEKSKWQDFVELTDNFYNLFIRRQDLFFYKPQKPINDINFYLNNMNLNIMQSNAIEKLRKLASLTN